MARSIATRTGDDGTTSLLYGQRVAKDHPLIEAVGAFDELNAALGAVKAQLGGRARTGASGEGEHPSTARLRDAELHALIETTQKNLIALMGELACVESDAERYAASKFEKLSDADVRRLDDAVASLEARGLNFDGWATPGANARAAALDVARATARRAERRLTSLPGHGRRVRPELRQFVNRLSDLLWLLAREAEQ